MVSKPLQLFTIASFLMLIAGFVLYRTGYFDRKQVPVVKSDSSKTVTDDTIGTVKLDTFWVDPMMSSSKSIHATVPVPVVTDSAKAE